MPRPSRPWFRFYVEAVHDRKLRRLKPEYRWLFVACLAAARQSCEPGVLLVGHNDPMGIADLADFAGMSSKETAAGMAALVTVGVIDWDVEDDVYSVPAWGDRQYESDDVTARTRKHRRERSKDVPRNVPGTPEGTPPETETEADTETPPTPLERIVDGVFVKVLAEKERRGERIDSTEGYRRWWDANQADGCRKRAAWMLEHYDVPTLAEQVAFTLSVDVPRWAAPYLRLPEAVA